MGFWSGLSSIASSVVSTVSRVASSAWDAAKDIAGRAVGWMAEKAEAFVDDVKRTWQTVKPFVEHIRVALRAAAAATVEIPFLSVALLALDRGLEALTAFENSPIRKKLEDAIAWAIELAKRWKKKQDNDVDNEIMEDHLSADDLKTAKRHQDNLRFAEREAVPESLRHELELTSAINDFEIAKTDLANAIDAAPENFEHYLRLRATQKLLSMADKTFRSAKSIDDVSADDLFLVRIASDLIKANPELGAVAAQRLDRLLRERHGRSLTPFVFEELIASWAVRSEALSKQWNDANRALARDTILLKRLSVAKSIQDELSEEEALELSRLEIEVPQRKVDQEALATRQIDLERYTGAAEGFLQLLEKTREQIEAEDRGYLVEEGADVGKILIDCAQHDVPFHTLTPEQQSLVNDYANIFKRESQARTERILKAAA